MPLFVAEGRSTLTAYFNKRREKNEHISYPLLDGKQEPQVTN